MYNFDVRDGLAEALAYKGGPVVVVDAVVDPFALSLPSHVPFHTAKGFTLSMAKQVWRGKMDDVIKTIKLPAVAEQPRWAGFHLLRQHFPATGIP
jgi:hypothetical protein